MGDAAIIGGMPLEGDHDDCPEKCIMSEQKQSKTAGSKNFPLSRIPQACGRVYWGGRIAFVSVIFWLAHYPPPVGVCPPARRPVLVGHRPRLHASPAQLRACEGS